VPLDVGFPSDRIAYIVSDAQADVVLSLSHLRGHLSQARALVIAALSVEILRPPRERS
jgi:non-ribosomal peptide synthetase component F